MKKPQKKSGVSENIEEKAEQKKEDVNPKSEDRKMYPAICSECGEKCEVPFEPVEGKPVKCKECYKKGRPKRFKNNRGFKREMHEAICSKCNKNCQVPFKPNGKKPILCKECYLKSKE